MNNYKLEIRWGFIFSVAMLLWLLVERLVGLHSTYIEYHMVWTNLFAVVAIAVYVFALRQKRDKELNGNMTWKQGFMSGVGITVVVAILSPLTQWLAHTVVSPHFFTNMVEFAVRSGNMTEAQALDYFSLQSYMMQAVIGAVAMGVITSAVVAFFVRNQK
ncbi:DUF4199 domain-containing protein [Pseudidiomarina gelatinasegens]|jgi:hypothetical protein|uniref:DUF4199 domain-containing protein n=1 Tax=Pseudidiomarina gelatinasegens TaxID=2487740 RepID=A0A443YZI8_9GAMM|nr:DUF4199 domain-containing protein [Pseudidiomarina gelatinasegens]RWU09582.1 DUF4199 domain-containing protein [Pseudidiomarina gelatinasegens]|tara:strand:+ start:443 stop:922 length:480 start_codon:yes stop_codon:yes gene_type:complete